MPAPEMQARIVEEVGIAFFFAPDYHPAMKHVMTARQEIGCKTIFNILGPLANPAGAQAQVFGVYRPDLTGTLAKVLRILGLSRAMVVHGAGLDEITTTGTTEIAELSNGAIRTYTIQCDTYGIVPAELADLAGGGCRAERPHHPRYPSGGAGCSTGHRAPECRGCHLCRRTGPGSA